MTPTNPQSPFRFFVDLFAHKAQDREILTPAGEAADDEVPRGEAHRHRQARRRIAGDVPQG